MAGLPLFGTLVAMLEDRRPVCGMIEVPAMRERWIGVADRTSLNGERCAVSACVHLRDARLCSTDPRMFSGGAERAFARLAREVRITLFGTDCYGYAMLASGHVDLVIEDGLQVHDVMAIVPVIQGAGGIIATWSGDAVDETFKGNIIAAATLSPSLSARLCGFGLTLAREDSNCLRRIDSLYPRLPPMIRMQRFFCWPITASWRG